MEEGGEPLKDDAIYARTALECIEEGLVVNSVKRSGEVEEG